MPLQQTETGPEHVDSAGRDQEETMFTKAMIALATTIAFGAASVVPAVSASAKARAARQAKPQVQYQTPGLRPGQATRPDGGPHSPNPANDVYVQGIYAGSDPDPRIRAYLNHDSPWNRTGP
jgi:hypothetical protein